MGKGGDSEDEDLNLDELRGLVETHLILADKGTCVATSDDSQECGIGKTMGERLGSLVSEHDMMADGYDRFRTGSG